MHDQLTENDIQQMKEELDYRRITLRPKLLEEVKTARAFGDLSENFEYKAAKREKNQNESRIRYLEKMIETAHIVSDRSAEDEVGLFDKVTVWFDETLCATSSPLHPLSARRSWGIRQARPSGWR